MGGDAENESQRALRSQRVVVFLCGYFGRFKEAEVDDVGVLKV